MISSSLNARCYNLAFQGFDQIRQNVSPCIFELDFVWIKTNRMVKRTPCGAPIYENPPLPALQLSLSLSLMLTSPDQALSTIAFFPSAWS